MAHMGRKHRVRSCRVQGRCSRKATDARCQCSPGGAVLTGKNSFQDPNWMLVFSFFGDTEKMHEDRRETERNIWKNLQKAF